jgi:ABC-type transporter Mla maintaining outer membrane lipid asymmetry permease subunit MlaE
MARIRKALAAAAGLAATVVAAGLLDDTTEAVVTSALAALTVVGVYAVPNEPATTRAPRP